MASSPSIPTFSVVILGSGGVGKSSLTLRFVTQKFSETYDATIEDSYRKVIEVDKDHVNLELLDTAGQEEFASMIDGWVRPAHGIILVFDVSSRQTFDELIQLYDRVVVAKHTDEIPLVLVGNKCDLSTEQRQIDPIEGKVLAASWQCKYIEASAKTRHNDVQCFYEIVRKIREFEPKKKETTENPQACCSVM